MWHASWQGVDALPEPRKEPSGCHEVRTAWMMYSCGVVANVDVAYLFPISFLWPFGWRRLPARSFRSSATSPWP